MTVTLRRTHNITTPGRGSSARPATAAWLGSPKAVAPGVIVPFDPGAAPELMKHAVAGLSRVQMGRAVLDWLNRRKIVSDCQAA